jgi:hypothetical protein
MFPFSTQKLSRQMYVCLLVCILQAIHCELANAQSSITGSFENYFVVAPHPYPGSPLQMSFLTAQDRLGPETKVIVGALHHGSSTMLDENYVATGFRGGVFRFGRFRTEFGHSDWSELYYFGLPSLPLIRSNDVGYDDADRLNLTRLDTGVDYLATSGAMRY